MRLRDLRPGLPVLLNDIPATFVKFDDRNGWFVFDVAGVPCYVFPCEIRAEWITCERANSEPKPTH
jgi:hypothetical protein